MRMFCVKLLVLCLGAVVACAGPIVPGSEDGPKLGVTAGSAGQATTKPEPRSDAAVVPEPGNVGGQATMQPEPGRDAAPVETEDAGVGPSVELPMVFRYADAVSTTGGEFNASFRVKNLMNSGFGSAQDTIDTTTLYAAAANNYATASGTTRDFELIFEFLLPTKVDGMHVWNYVYRNLAGGAASTTSGVKDYSLTFYSEAGGSGAVIGVFAGTLAAATYNSNSPAQTVTFGTSYPNVRSVVMHVDSNHGSNISTGINELAFNAEASSIGSFESSAAFVQRPATATLSWTVRGAIASLDITPDIGDVLPLTVAGSGSVSVSPIGEQTYTLTVNGVVQESLSVIGLPTKDKVHLYLLIGQSNMAGVGAPFDANLDHPHPRVLKFGSRDGMEQTFVTGGHALPALTSDGDIVGMGVEFGKTMIAAQTDEEVVIGLINHALGGTAIEWWEPGAVDTEHVNPKTGLSYMLYDEAVARVEAAKSFGELKGVLWHQGEYNALAANRDPQGYAVRLYDLVMNLRTTFANTELPFVCGKLVPAAWVDDFGNPVEFNALLYRAIVEAALMELPNLVPFTACVDNDGLRGITGNLIHFDAPSQRELGRRYAAAMSQWIP